MFRNIKKIATFIPLLFLILTFNVNANVREELKTSKSCGTYENTNIVKLFSWEICEQDFTYRMFYKMMPEIMDDYIVPVTSAENLGNIKELEKDRYFEYKTNEYSIVNIAKGVVSLAFAFGSFVLIWHILLAILRTSADGKFLGQGYSWQRNLMKYGFILIMLLPAGNGLILINILVVILIVFAIAIGNSVLSVYLNFFDVGEESVDLTNSYTNIDDLFEDNKSLELSNIVKNDHNYFAGFQYIESLMKMQMCKAVTERHLVNNIQDILIEKHGNNKAEYDNLLDCMVRPNNSSIATSNPKKYSGINYNDESQGFATFHISNTGLKDDKNKVYATSGITFGYDKFFSNDSCKKFSEIQPYKCGKMSITPTNPQDSLMTGVMNDTNFIKFYKKATSGVASNIESGNVQAIERIIADSWNEYNQILVKRLTKKDKDGNLSLSQNDENLIKSISYNFHQQLVNDIYTGILIVHNKKSADPISNGSGHFQNRINQLNGLSNFVLETKCYSEPLLNNAAFNFADSIKNKKTGNENISSFCIEDIKYMEPFNELIKIEELSEVELAKKQEENEKRNEVKLTKLKEDFIELQKEALKIQAALTAVERSFFHSLKTIKKSSLTADMRKLGFVSAGSLGLKLIKSNDIDSKMMTALRSSVGFEFYFDDKFIGNEEQSTILDRETSADNFTFPSMVSYLDMVTSDIKTERYDLRQANLRSMTQGLINDNADNAIRSEEALTRLFSVMSNPMGGFKRAMGYDNSANLNLETMKSCFEDIEKCPIPVANPIIGITDFGNDMVSTGAGLIATTVAVVFADFTSKKIKSVKLKYKKTAEIKNDADNAVGKQLAGTGFMGKVASVASSALSVASIILKLLFPLFIIMISVGMFFAYVIPLIPFMMFQFSYIAWITLCLTIFFISPLWLIMNIQLEQDANTSNNMYRSGYSMAMQILFRPAILTLAMGIGWSLFSAAFLILNLTVAPYFIGMSESGSSIFFIGSIINAIVLIVIYAIMAVVIIKYIFNITYTLINKIFDAMNVENFDDKHGNVTDDVMKSALISNIVGAKGLGGLGKGLDMVSKSGDSSLKAAEGNTMKDQMSDVMDVKMAEAGDQGENDPFDQGDGKSKDNSEEESKGKDKDKNDKNKSKNKNKSEFNLSNNLNQLGDSASNEVNREAEKESKDLES